MRWIRRLCVPLVLVVLAATVLEAGAIGAVTNRAKRGATYQGTGRQPNWPKGYLTWSATFSLRFRVASDGRHVTQIWVWGLNAFCGNRNRYPASPNPKLGSAPIRRDGTFQVDLKPTDGAVNSPIRVTGRFLSQGRASGTLRYRGRYRTAPSRCNADGTWAARVKPPPPPVQHFTGATSQGTRVTFQRTIERRPHVLRFNFGSLPTYRPGSPPTNCGTRTVATGPGLAPPYDQFSLPVNRGSFSGHYFHDVDVIDVTGRFDAKGQATGTVNYVDRADCTTGTVQWTAHITPPPPPVQQFTGTTAQGTRVTFQRTIERNPHVTRFTFDSLRPSHPFIACGAVTVTTGPNNEPPHDEFALPVRNGHFSGQYMSWMADWYINITGHFDAKDRASGTVSYGDRVDCMTGTVQWTAHWSAPGFEDT